MKKIKLYKKNGTLINNMWGGFALGYCDYHDNKMTLAGTFDSCRSFTGDAIVLKKLGTDNNRMVSYPLAEWFNINKGNTYCAIQIKKEEIETFKNNISFLHKKEEQAKVKKSVIHETNSPFIFIVEGSSYWKKNSWATMLWTFYIKCMRYNKPKECDPQYWQDLTRDNNEDVFLSKVKIKTEIFDKSVYGKDLKNNLHVYHGFVSICNGSNEPMAKHLGLKHTLGKTK